VVGDIPAWRKFTGQTKKEIQGMGWLAAIHPDDRERTAEAWKAAVENGRLYEVDYRIRHHDGSYRRFKARGVPVLERDGSIREWMGVCAEII